MLINKPIIAIIDGCLPNSEVKIVMDETNLGVSFESAEKDSEYVKLKAYVESQYERYIRGLEIDFNPDEKVINRYNWDSVIKQFDKIIDLEENK